MFIYNEIAIFAHMKILSTLLYAIFYSFSLLPLRVHYLLSTMLYVLLRYVVRYRLKVVRKNMSTSFPEKSEHELRAIENGFYRFFCDYLVESVKLMTIRRENLKKRMVFKGVEQVDQCIHEGQSVAVYLGHYCNWEWVTSLPLWITSEALCGQIYHPIENKAFDRLFLRLRQRQGALCIPMQDTLRRIIEFRRKNQPVVIGYISDQKPNWINIHHWLDFLHHDTPVLTGAERIIRKAGHAVFYLDLRRVKRGYYEAEFKLIARNPNEVDDEFGITDIYYQMLEQSIIRAPELWLWSHNRWSRTREEFNERFEVNDGKVTRLR